MKIINKTNNSVVAEEVIVASNFFKRMKGLLGKKELRPNQALVLKPCNSIHTFFMHFPIDVLFVDKNNRIIKAISCLKPFKLTPIYLNAAFAIELPFGTIQSFSIQIGDTLLLTEKSA
jgi:uncharacterized membrane protein (UPF0127 family)